MSQDEIALARRDHDRVLFYAMAPLVGFVSLVLLPFSLVGLIIIVGGFGLAGLMGLLRSWSLLLDGTANDAVSGRRFALLSCGIFAAICGLLISAYVCGHEARDPGTAMTYFVLGQASLIYGVLVVCFIARAAKKDRDSPSSRLALRAPALFIVVSWVISLLITVGPFLLAQAYLGSTYEKAHVQDTMPPPVRNAFEKAFCSNDLLSANRAIESVKVLGPDAMESILRDCFPKSTYRQVSSVPRYRDDESDTDHNDRLSLRLHIELDAILAFESVHSDLQNDSCNPLRKSYLANAFRFQRMDALKRYAAKGMDLHCIDTQHAPPQPLWFLVGSVRPLSVQTLQDLQALGIDL